MPGRRRVPRIDVLHVGSAARDVADDDPRGWRLGGGVIYAALATARLGLRTAAVVGVDRHARTAHELDQLRDAGVDLLLVPLAEGPVFRNDERPTGRVQTCVAPGRSLPVPPLAESWLAARAWSIVPVADEVSDGWAAAIPADAYVVVGWQGFLRELAPGSLVVRREPRPGRLLARADLVGASRGDFDSNEVPGGLHGLLHPGAALLVTGGAAGGVLLEIEADRVLGRGRTYRAIPADAVIDATGAGDTMLAALLATALRAPRGSRMAERLDLRFAAAAGSLVVEGMGLAAVPDRQAVLARMERLPSAGQPRGGR